MKKSNRRVSTSVSTRVLKETPASKVVTVVDSSKDDIAYHVYRTTDYGKFKMLDENRSVTESRAKKILNSINKIGYIENPIIVNEKFEILDGQGRFTVLQQLGKPIDYVIAEGKGIDEARQLNLGQTNWSVMDYVQSYACGGNQNYALLLKLCNDFPNFSEQEISCILKNKINSSVSQETKNGTLVITEKQYRTTAAKLAWLNEHYNEISKINGSRRLIISAIAWIYGLDNINKERLELIIKNRYSQIKPMFDINIALEDLSDLYNSGIRKERFYFDSLYKEYTRQCNSIERKNNARV